MTGLLKEVLADHADQADLGAAHVQTAIAAGRSRLRRQRLMRGGAAAIAVALVALAVPGLQQIHQADDQGSNAAQPGKVAGQGDFAERKVTYAAGSEIHYGEQTISVAPVKVHAFVQVTNGFGIVTADHEVFFADGDTVTKISMAGAPYGTLIASDDEAAVFGWADLSTDGEATFYAYDSATGEAKSTVRPAAKPGEYGEFDIPRVSAVDGANLYVVDSEGTKRWNLETGKVDKLKAGVTDRWLADAEDGWLGFDDSPAESDEGTSEASAWGNDVVIAKDPTATSPRYPSGRVEFSPDATYFANDHDDTEQILTRENGLDVTPDHSGYEFIALMQWVDDDSFVAVGFANAESESFDLLNCSVEGGSCETAVAGLSTQQVELPIGASINDE